MNTSIGTLLKNSAEAVITPLKNGLISLTRVYESLIIAEVDPITGQCTNYTAIRQQIVQTQQSLERSEQAANAGLKSLDEHLERLTVDMGRLEQEITETERNLNNLRTEKSSSERSLNDSNCALDQARRHLASAEQTLRSLEEKKREAEIKTGVGAGLFLIPFVGWIAGAVLVSVGAVDLSQASHALGVANDEVRRSESELEKFRNRVSELQNTISSVESQIRDKQVNIEQMNRDKQNVKQQRESVGEFQGKARKAVHLLNDLSGKTKVVECQTRKFILQEPVMNVMEEVLNAAGAITGNELLCTENIPQLLNTMKENHQRLVAVCA